MPRRQLDSVPGDHQGGSSHTDRGQHQRSHQVNRGAPGGERTAPRGARVGQSRNGRDVANESGVTFLGRESIFPSVHSTELLEGQGCQLPDLLRNVSSDSHTDLQRAVGCASGAGHVASRSNTLKEQLSPRLLGDSGARSSQAPDRPPYSAMAAVCSFNGDCSGKVGRVHCVPAEGADFRW